MSNPGVFSSFVASGTLPLTLFEKITDEAQSIVYRLGVDYVIGYDDDLYCVITRLTAGLIPPNATIKVSYHQGDPTGNRIIQS